VHTLLGKLHKRLPWLKIGPAFSWVSTFAETSDGLLYFGPHLQYGLRVLFAMACGGNGIVFCSVSADILLGDVRAECQR